MNRIRNTKIVCTIGPASETKETLTKMIQNGMNVARLNFSHGSYEHDLMLINHIRSASAELKKPIAIMQDLQGPKIRVGKIAEEGIEVQIGDTLIIIPENLYKEKPQKGKTKIIPTQYHDLWKDVKRGHKIMLDDALVQVVVKKISNKKIYCEVKNDGIIFSNKGINTPDATIQARVITPKDIKDLKFGLSQNIDFVALSFVKAASEIKNLEKIISRITKKPKFTQPKIIAKIERQEALKNIDEIIDAADGLMIARGDLGVELPPEDVPIIQKKFIDKCLLKSKPVIVATQMLDSMIKNPMPTRAEVSDVANAVIDHTDAVMLSGETAFGKYPAETVKMMSKIINETEMSRYDDLPHGYLKDMSASVNSAVSHAVHELSKNVNAKVILVATASGFSARMISRHRPQKSVICAITNHVENYRQLTLSWGIEPFLSTTKKTIDQLINSSIKFIAKKQTLKKGDKIIIITGHPVGKPGKMNLIRIHEI